MFTCLAAQGQTAMPPDSAFSLCGMSLGMDAYDIRWLVDNSAWKFRNSEDRDNIISSDLLFFTLNVEDRLDSITCIGKGDPQYKGAECLRFDEVSWTPYNQKACRLSWEAGGFKKEDVGELREFTTLLLDRLVKSFGKPKSGWLKPGQISVTSLAKREGERGYSTIAEWEWKDGKGRKSKTLRSIWISTERQGDSYRLLVVMEDTEKSEKRFSFGE